MTDVSSPEASLTAAYRYCARLARTHYENFPVASWLLPRAMRAPVTAVYAFARTADDFADEGERPVAERHRLLDEWLERLHGCVEPRVREAPGKAPGAGIEPEPSEADQVFLALGDTIRRHDLPLSCFEDLVSAFRQDITTHRYDSWDGVLDYCRRSANPVGRLVLRIAGYRSAALDESSDHLCTALQLTNFWQDLGRDFARGRLYVPAADWRDSGARVEDLGAGRLGPEWTRALANVIGRTHELFERGRAVCDGVHGRLAFELRLTWLGGRRILRRVSESAPDLPSSRPRLTFRDGPALLREAVVWRRPSPEGGYHVGGNGAS